MMAEDFPSELSSLLGATDAAARETAWPAFLNSYSRLLLHVARQVGHDYDAAMDAYTYIVEQLRAGDYHRLRGGWSSCLGGSRSSIRRLERHRVPWAPGRFPIGGGEVL
jgi:hypothetical protein